MIWLTWRQFRAQSIVAATALAATAVVLGLTGAHLGPSVCRRRRCPLATPAAAVPRPPRTSSACSTAGFANHLPLLFGTALIVVPAVIGIFWGAPLVTRELETGTSNPWCGTRA